MLPQKEKTRTATPKVDFLEEPQELPATVVPQSRSLPLWLNTAITIASLTALAMREVPQQPFTTINEDLLRLLEEGDIRSHETDTLYLEKNYLLAVFQAIVDLILWHDSDMPAQMNLLNEERNPYDGIALSNTEHAKLLEYKASLFKQAQFLVSRAKVPLHPMDMVINSDEEFGYTDTNKYSLGHTTTPTHSEEQFKLSQKLFAKAQEGNEIDTEMLLTLAHLYYPCKNTLWNLIYFHYAVENDDEAFMLLNQFKDLNLNSQERALSDRLRQEVENNLDRNDIPF